MTNAGRRPAPAPSLACLLLLLLSDPARPFVVPPRPSAPSYSSLRRPRPNVALPAGGSDDGARAARRAQRREERRAQRKAQRREARRRRPSPPPPSSRDSSPSSSSSSGGGGDDKFSFAQRIESIKTAAVGALAGGIVSTPFIALHDIPLYGAASWEFDTDMGSVQSALFAIVYRYCVREDDDNDMLNMGAVGAFVLVRTLSRIRVPSYCAAAPLDCGAPLGYFDYDMLRQLAFNGAESAALFGGAALAMEYAYDRGWIGKFPN